jgi:hypothetical protein
MEEKKWPTELTMPHTVSSPYLYHENSTWGAAQKTEKKNLAVPTTRTSCPRTTVRLPDMDNT